jgi:hypothetical protein
MVIETTSMHAIVLNDYSNFFLSPHRVKKLDRETQDPDWDGSLKLGS